MSRRRREKRFIIAAAVLVFVLPAAMVLATLLVLRNPDCDYLTNIRDPNPYFSLPPGAKNVGEHHFVSSRSCSVWLRFEASPSEVSAFVTTTLIKQPLSSTKLPQTLRDIQWLEEETGWQFGSAKSFLAGEDTDAGFLNAQTVFIDTTSSEHYMVYLKTTINWL